MAQVIADRRDVDFVLYEQFDAEGRMASSYEGTNGIQTMELLGRKIGMEKGRVFMNFMHEVRRVVQRGQTCDGLSDLADKVEWDY